MNPRSVDKTNQLYKKWDSSSDESKVRQQTNQLLNKLTSHSIGHGGNGRFAGGRIHSHKNSKKHLLQMQVEDTLILSAEKQAVKRENLYMRFIYEHSVNTAFFEDFY